MKKSHRTFDAQKRLFDVVISCIGLVMVSPVMVVIAILVRARLGKPIIFVQERPGKKGRVFLLRKFRTMANPDPARGLMDDEDRLSSFGEKLRSRSLDELPTLLNVLRGDMSIVGPRPLLVSYLDRYSTEQARRHEVRPGVTGLAQVSGRNKIAWDEKFRLDVKYVDERCWKLDVQIILRTFVSVFRRDGISSEGHVTMPEFMGDSR